MKKVLFLLSLLLVSISFVNCSGNDDEVMNPTPVISMPQELIGTWQINKYGWLDEPEMTASNDKGFFIKFNADNTVEYKDTNTTFKGVDILLFSI